MLSKCKCGCGQNASHGNFVRGHHMRRKSMKKELRRRARKARKYLPKVRSTSWRKKISEAQCGKKRKPHTNSTKKKIAKASKKLWKSIDHQRMMSSKMRRCWKNPEYRAKVRNKWSDPKFIARISRKKSRTIRKQYATGERSITNIGGHPRFTHGWMCAKKSGRIYYRSGWELAFIKLLSTSSLVKKFVSEPFAIPYRYKGKKHSFFPDFLLELKNGEKWLVEIKGEFKESTRQKYKAANRYCEKYGYNWGVVTEKPIKPLTEYLQ